MSGFGSVFMTKTFLEIGSLLPRIGGGQFQWDYQVGHLPP